MKWDVDVQDGQLELQRQQYDSRVSQLSQLNCAKEEELEERITKELDGLTNDEQYIQTKS